MCTLLLQLSKIVEFRNDQVLRDTNRAMQATLDVLQNIAFQNQRENETLAKLALNGQSDSKTLKALTLIATMYLPASLIAVNMLDSSPLFTGC